MRTTISIQEYRFPKEMIGTITYLELFKIVRPNFGRRSKPQTSLRTLGGRFAHQATQRLNNLAKNSVGLCPSGLEVGVDRAWVAGGDEDVVARRGAREFAFGELFGEEDHAEFGTAVARMA